MPDKFNESKQIKPVTTGSKQQNSKQVVTTGGMPPQRQPDAKASK